MPKFRYSLDSGTSWVVVDSTLPYAIPSVGSDTVMVEPIGAAVTVAAEFGISSPLDVASGAAGGLLTVTTNRSDGTLYWFVSTSATPPTAANLKAGTGATKFGSQAVTAIGAQSATVAGLAVSTLYYAHFLHTNAAAQDSNIVTGDGFTTAAYPTFASVTGFGDSMMAGSTATTAANRFLNRFVAATGGGTLRNSGIGATVLQNSNDASAAPRTDNGRDRFVAATLGSNLSEVLLNSYGYNDMRYIGAPATFNVAAFENDYNEVLAGQIAGGYARDKVYLNTPFWVTDAILSGALTPGFAPATRAQVLDYVAACRRVARDWGVRFVDIYTATVGRTDLIDVDGVHPNDAGHLFYKDLLLAASVINARAAMGGTATGGVNEVTLAATDPGNSPTSYTARLLQNSNNILGATITQAGTAFTFSSVTPGSYRVMFRANYADGTSTPWALSSVVVASGVGTVYGQTESYASTPDDTALTATSPTTGGPWTSRFSTSAARIRGGRIVNAAAGTASVASLAATRPLTGSTLSAEGVLDVKSNTVGSALLCMRMNSASNQSYLAAGYNTAAGNQLWIYFVDNGTFTTIAGPLTQTLAVGEHTIRFEVEVGAQRLYVNGALALSATVPDGSLGVNLGQNIGVRMNGAVTESAGPTWKSITYSYT